jgi:glycogen(starch) synthase
MRILHILDHSLPLHSGYTFRTRAIVKAQLARGWDARCLTGPRHAAEGPDPEVLDGITFHRTKGPAPAPAPLAGAERARRAAGGAAAWHSPGL